MKLLGKYCSLRLVNIEDAEFILELRTNEKKSKYLNKTKNDIFKQKQWLEKYKIKEINGTEYYFIIEDNKGTPVGTYRLYDILDNQATPGSWIIKDNTDLTITIESVLLMYDFIFNTLYKPKIYFDVRKANKRVIRFHESYGSKCVNEDDDNCYYEFYTQQWPLMQQKMNKLVTIK